MVEWEICMNMVIIAYLCELRIFSFSLSQGVCVPFLSLPNKLHKLKTTVTKHRIKMDTSSESTLVRTGHNYNGIHSLQMVEGGAALGMFFSVLTDLADQIDALKVSAAIREEAHRVEIAHMQNTISDLEPLKEMLVVVKLSNATDYHPDHLREKFAHEVQSDDETKDIVSGGIIRTGQTSLEAYMLVTGRTYRDPIAKKVALVEGFADRKCPEAEVLVYDNLDPQTVKTSRKYCKWDDFRPVSSDPFTTFYRYMMKPRKVVHEEVPVVEV